MYVQIIYFIFILYIYREFEVYQMNGVFEHELVLNSIIIIIVIVIIIIIMFGK